MQRAASLIHSSEITYLLKFFGSTSPHCHCARQFVSMNTMVCSCTAILTFQLIQVRVFFVLFFNIDISKCEQLQVLYKEKIATE